MSHARLLPHGTLALLVAALSAAGAVGAQTTAPATPTSLREGRAQATIDTAGVTVLLYEEDVVSLADGAADHLDRARAALVAGDRDRAADQVATAAAYVRVALASASASDTADIRAAAADLDAIAGRVRTGALRTPGQLDSALDGIDYALARHHLTRARRAWAARAASKAGRELRGAARHTERLARDVGRETERGARATGRGVERGTEDAVRGTRAVSAKLIDGAGWTAGEVGKGFDGLGAEIDRLGRKVKPH